MELVDNKPVTRPVRRPFVTEGEFGVLISRIFGAKSQATITWNRWDTWQNKRVAVFDFAVDRAHSSWRLTLGVVGPVTVPYHGSVYAQPETGAVWKIESIVDNTPELKLESSQTIVEYQEIQIGTALHLLPVSATDTVRLQHDQIRNELEFKDYRKFEAESTIKFGTADQQPEQH